MGKQAYTCIRNCFVNVQLWKAGKTYELPEAMEKDPKNFRLVGAPEPVIEPERTEPAKPTEPRALGPGEYVCSKCENPHRESSKIGKKHLKHK